MARARYENGCIFVPATLLVQRSIVGCSLTCMVCCACIGSDGSVQRKLNCCRCIWYGSMLIAVPRLRQPIITVGHCDSGELRLVLGT